MSKIITFEYAFNNLGAFQTQPIPNNKKCMTKQDILNYINVQQAPLQPYAGNQLVPIDKVFGIQSNPMPSDLTYYLVGTNSYNQSDIFGVDEMARINNMPNTDNHFNCLTFNTTIFRKSNTDPSFDYNFLFPIDTTPSLQPLNEILKDVYDHYGIPHDKDVIIRRSNFQIIDTNPNIDFGDRTFMSTFEGRQSSQEFIDMHYGIGFGGIKANPKKNLGFMKFTATDDQNPTSGNLFNIVPPRSYLNVGSGQANLLTPMFHATHIINSTHSSSSGGNTNIYDVSYSYYKMECFFEVASVDTGQLIQQFNIKFFQDF